nr:hypothetical protein CFP56_77934 [Quercus suber]
MAAANVANYLPFLCTMAAANVARINHAEPGPIDTTLLTQQPIHRIQGPLPAAAVVQSSPIESQWWTTESLTL